MKDLVFNEISLLIISFIFIYFISNKLIRKHIFQSELDENKNYNNDFFSISNLLKDRFSIYFSFSNLLLVIVLFEIKNGNNHETIWNIYSTIFTIVNFYLIPAELILKLNGFKDLSSFIYLGIFRKIKVLIIFVFYLIFAGNISYLLQYNKSKNFLSFYFDKNIILEYIAILSVCISSVLGAYGTSQFIISFIIIPSNEKTFITLKNKLHELESEQQNLNLQYSKFLTNSKLDMESESCADNNINRDVNQQNNILNLTTTSSSFNHSQQSNIEKELEFILSENQSTIFYIIEKLAFNLTYKEYYRLNNKTNKNNEEISNKMNLEFNNNKFHVDKWQIFRFYFLKIFFKIFSLYSIYRVIMCLKNLLYYEYFIEFSKNQTFIDRLLLFIIKIFHECKIELVLDIELTFSICFIVIMIIINIRSFYKSIELIILKVLKQMPKVTEESKEILLCFIISMLYLSSSVSILGSIPEKFRINLNLNNIGNIGLLKLYNDIVFITIFTITMIIEYLNFLSI